MSQFTEPVWTDPGLKSGVSVRELISTLKYLVLLSVWSIKHLMNGMNINRSNSDSDRQTDVPTVNSNDTAQ